MNKKIFFAILTRNKIFRARFFSVLFFSIFSLNLCSALPAYGAPSISGVSGNLTHGANVTVGGSGFGVKTHALPQFWDTVENQPAYSGLLNGSTIPTGGQNPWGSNTGNSVKYSTMNQRNAFNGANYMANSDNAKLNDHLISGTQYFYISWWFNPNNSVEIVSPATSNKFLRVSNSQDEINKTYSWSLMGDYVYSSAYCQFGGSLSWFNWTGVIGKWNKLEVWFNSANRTFESYTNGVSNNGIVSWNGCATFNFDKVWGLGWESNGGNTVQFWMDDIYIDNTLSRIELCQGLIRTNRGKCEIQIPTAWSQNSITISANQGAFQSGQTVYLYVVDANGEVNPNGYPVVIGNGGDTTPPGAPANLTVR